MTIKLSISFMLGFLACQYVFTRAYDPEKLRLEGYLLAFNSYMLACLEAGDRREACLYRANRWYEGIKE